MPPLGHIVGDGTTGATLAPAAVDRGLHRQHGGPGGVIQRIRQRSGGQRQGWFVEFQKVPSKANVPDAVSRDDFMNTNPRSKRRDSEHL